ncbi:hypothetical protein HNV11_12960 [Spirosoma taeanense]|uniref:Uncharacterized protein n=1 Tax=Spirosoma taeanense TaxID=2735870 RepID=A0A6M5YA97_9BACT|nr:hypothetical protein [Spirosoma taeanense]QJW90220.1 hypothetical protein HNV11_12960 [Spirosoma taeanense]
MKAKEIRFFKIEDNSEQKPKVQAKPATITGYISTGGKIVFPAKSVKQLNFDPETTRFKVGVQQGKRKIKSLFLVPADDQSEAFDLIKAAKSYTIALALILQKSGIDYANTKYSFTVKPFEYEAGVTGYELQLDDQSPKAEYTGKPRGRKRKTTENATQE